jgi:hypothetical protein
VQKLLLAATAIPLWTLTAIAEPQSTPYPNSVQGNPSPTAGGYGSARQPATRGAGQKAKVQPPAKTQCKTGDPCKKAKTQQVVVGQ